MGCPCEQQDQCEIEPSQLPLISECPNDNAYIIFGNITGGLGNGKYGRMLWRDVKNCISSAQKPLKFIVGRGEATDPIAGQSTWTNDVLKNLGADDDYEIEWQMDGQIFMNYGLNKNCTYDPTTGTINVDYGGSGNTFQDGAGGSISLNQ